MLPFWQASESDQVRTSITREVAQLDFVEFASAINVVDASSLIGNPNLEPETALTYNIGGAVNFGGFRATVDYWDDVMGGIIVFDRSQPETLTFGGTPQVDRWLSPVQLKSLHEHTLATALAASAKPEGRLTAAVDSLTTSYTRVGGQTRDLNDEFLNGLARVLMPGGEFLLKTDDAVYFEDAQASLGARAEFERLDWPDDAFVYPMTDFEEHWLSLGRSMNRARWRRV